MHYSIRKRDRSDGGTGKGNRKKGKRRKKNERSEGVPPSGRRVNSREVESASRVHHRACIENQLGGSSRIFPPSCRSIFPQRPATPLGPASRPLQFAAARPIHQGSDRSLPFFFLFSSSCCTQTCHFARRVSGANCISQKCIPGAGIRNTF